MSKASKKGHVEHGLANKIFQFQNDIKNQKLKRVYLS